MCFFAQEYPTPLHRHCRHRQRVTGRFFVPGVSDHGHGSVKCFSDRPHALLFASGDGALSLPNTGQACEIEYSYRATEAGSDTALLHMVSASAPHTLLHSWLLSVTATAPELDRPPYEVLLPAPARDARGGGSSTGAAAVKEFSYENRSRHARTLLVESSAPDLLSVATPALNIGPNGTVQVRIRIHPPPPLVCSPGPGRRSVYVFISDKNGHSESCLQFNLEWEATRSQS